MKFMMFFLLILLISSCVFAPVRAPHSHTYVSLQNNKKRLKVYCISNLKTLYFYDNKDLEFKVKSIIFSKDKFSFNILEYKNIFDRKSYQTSERITDDKFHKLFKQDSLVLFSSATNSEEKYYSELDINLQ